MSSAVEEALQRAKAAASRADRALGTGSRGTPSVTSTPPKDAGVALRTSWSIGASSEQPEEEEAAKYSSPAKATDDALKARRNLEGERRASPYSVDDGAPERRRPPSPPPRSAAPQMVGSGSFGGGGTAAATHAAMRYNSITPGSLTPPKARGSLQDRPSPFTRTLPWEEAALAADSRRLSFSRPLREHSSIHKRSWTGVMEENARAKSAPPLRPGRASLWRSDHIPQDEVRSRLISHLQDVNHMFRGTPRHHMRIEPRPVDERSHVRTSLEAPGEIWADGLRASAPAPQTSSDGLSSPVLQRPGGKAADPRSFLKKGEGPAAGMQVAKARGLMSARLDPSPPRRLTASAGPGTSRASRPAPARPALTPTHGASPEWLPVRPRDIFSSPEPDRPPTGSPSRDEARARHRPKSRKKALKQLAAPRVRREDHEERARSPPQPVAMAWLNFVSGNPAYIIRTPIVSKPTPSPSRRSRTSAAAAGSSSASPAAGQSRSRALASSSSPTKAEARERRRTPGRRTSGGSRSAAAVGQSPAVAGQGRAGKGRASSPPPPLPPPAVDPKGDLAAVGEEPPRFRVSDWGQGGGEGGAWEEAGGGRPLEVHLSLDLLDLGGGDASRDVVSGLAGSTLGRSSSPSPRTAPSPPPATPSPSPVGLLEAAGYYVPSRGSTGNTSSSSGGSSGGGAGAGSADRYEGRGGPSHSTLSVARPAGGNGYGAGEAAMPGTPDPAHHHHQGGLGAGAGGVEGATDEEEDRWSPPEPPLRGNADGDPGAWEEDGWQTVTEDDTDEEDGTRVRDGAASGETAGPPGEEPPRLIALVAGGEGIQEVEEVEVDLAAVGEEPPRFRASDWGQGGGEGGAGEQEEEEEEEEENEGSGTDGDGEEEPPRFRVSDWGGGSGGGAGEEKEEEEEEHEGSGTDGDGEASLRGDRAAEGTASGGSGNHDRRGSFTFAETARPGSRGGGGKGGLPALPGGSPASPAAPPPIPGSVGGPASPLVASRSQQPPPAGDALGDELGVPRVLTWDGKQWTDAQSLSPAPREEAPREGDGVAFSSSSSPPPPKVLGMYPYSSALSPASLPPPPPLFGDGSGREGGGPAGMSKRILTWDGNSWCDAQALSPPPVAAAGGEGPGYAECDGGGSSSTSEGIGVDSPERKWGGGDFDGDDDDEGSWLVRSPPEGKAAASPPPPPPPRALPHGASEAQPWPSPPLRKISHEDGPAAGAAVGRDPNGGAREEGPPGDAEGVGPEEDAAPEGANPPGSRGAAAAGGEEEPSTRGLLPLQGNGARWVGAASHAPAEAAGGPSRPSESWDGEGWVDARSMSPTPPAWSPPRSMLSDDAQGGEGETEEGMLLAPADGGQPRGAASGGGGEEAGASGGATQPWGENPAAAGSSTGVSLSSSGGGDTGGEGGGGGEHQQQQQQQQQQEDLPRVMTWDGGSWAPAESLSPPPPPLGRPYHVPGADGDGGGDPGGKGALLRGAEKRRRQEILSGGGSAGASSPGKRAREVERSGEADTMGVGGAASPAGEGDGPAGNGAAAETDPPDRTGGAAAAELVLPERYGDTPAPPPAAYNKAAVHAAAARFFRNLERAEERAEAGKESGSEVAPIPPPASAPVAHAAPRSAPQFFDTPPRREQTAVGGKPSAEGGGGPFPGTPEGSLAQIDSTPASSPSPPAAHPVRELLGALGGTPTAPRPSGSGASAGFSPRVVGPRFGPSPGGSRRGGVPAAKPAAEGGEGDPPRLPLWNPRDAEAAARSGQQQQQHQQEGSSPRTPPRHLIVSAPYSPGGSARRPGAPGSPGGSYFPESPHSPMRPDLAYSAEASEVLSRMREGVLTGKVDRDHGGSAPSPSVSKSGGGTPGSLSSSGGGGGGGGGEVHVQPLHLMMDGAEVKVYYTRSLGRVREVAVKFLRVPNRPWQQGMRLELGTASGGLMLIEPTDFDTFNLWVSALRVAFGRAAAQQLEGPQQSSPLGK